MKGLESVVEELGKLRFRVSRLLDLGRVPERQGKDLLDNLIAIGNEAQALELEERDARK